MADTPEEIHSLAGRIEKLEKQNRRLKLGGIAVLVLAGATLFVGWAVAPLPRTIVASNFEVKDAQGTVRADLGMNSEGVPMFRLYDASGKLRAVLVVTNDGPGFALYDASGKTRALFNVDNGGPSLVLADTSGKPRALLGVSNDGQFLGLYDASRKLRAGLGVTNNNGPFLGLYDASGKKRAGLSVTNDGEPKLNLNDPAGFETDIGSTSLVTPATGETHQTSAASIVMFDKKKHAIWQAPPNP